MNEKMRSFVKGLIMGRNSVIGSIPMAVMLAGKQEEQTPIAYLYNGAQLPPLPDVAGCDYKLLFKDSTKPNADITLILANCEMVYFPYFGGAVVFLHNASYQYHEYTLQGSEFVFVRTVVSNEASSNDGVFSGDFIWTNNDIRKELDDYTLGEVVYSASEPIPVYPEPVAYLYNGVRLPKLPESALPYAFIYLKYGTLYELCVLDAGVHYEVQGKYEYLIGDNSTKFITYRCNVGDAEWTVYNQGNLSGYLFSGEISDLLKWTNTDILNEADGSIFMSASEPIPVYE